MKSDYTHLTVILDRTGSMESIRDDTIGGFNAFLTGQQDEPGEATLTLVQFDSQDPYEIIHHFKPIANVPLLTRQTFVPRASTPLLDALGRGINDLEQSLGQKAEAERPARVVMVIITDGQENASREFRKNQIEKMITEKAEKSDWQFVYLSADVNAFDDATSYGIPVGAILRFGRSRGAVKSALGSLSRQASKYHAAKLKVAFDEEDRKNAE